MKRLLILLLMSYSASASQVATLFNGNVRSIENCYDDVCDIVLNNKTVREDISKWSGLRDFDDGEVSIGDSISKKRYYYNDKYQDRYCLSFDCIDDKDVCYSYEPCWLDDDIIKNRLIRESKKRTRIVLPFEKILNG